MSLGLLISVLDDATNQLQFRYAFPLRLCLGVLTLGLGKSGRCSRPVTNKKLAKMRLEYDFRASDVSSSHLLCG